MFSDFVFLQRGDAAIWIDRCCAEQAFVDRLVDADGLFVETNCQIIKDQKKIKVGRLTLPIAGQRRSLYIKRYNVFSVRYRLVSSFIRSGARRALHGAAILRAAAVPMAKPVAAIENRRRGALNKSYFISEEVAGSKTADDYWKKELRGLKGREGILLRRRFLSDLAALFCSLHVQQIYHDDLKDANILVGAEQANQPFRFYLLDLEGVKRYARMSSKRKIKNLVQINRTLGRFLRGPDKLFFLKRYLGADYGDRKVRRQWVKGVMEETNHLDSRKARMKKDVVTSKQTRD